MKLRKLVTILLGLAFMLGCSPPVAALPTATATVPATATATSAPFTPIPSATSTNPAPPNPDFCTDPAISTLLQSFKSAILNSNGTLLALLVSPGHGLDVRFFRYAAPVNYDQEHAKFVFETTFVINWGPAPGSGQDLQGSFQDVIIPPLKAVLGSASTTYSCDQIKTGGASYNPEWLYPNIKYFSIFFPGTDTYGGLDWETWLTGIHYVQGQPYLYALIHLDWEP